MKKSLLLAILTGVCVTLGTACTKVETEDHTPTAHTTTTTESHEVSARY